MILFRGRGRGLKADVNLALGLLVGLPVNVSLFYFEDESFALMKKQDAILRSQLSKKIPFPRFHILQFISTQEKRFSGEK